MLRKNPGGVGMGRVSIAVAPGASRNNAAENSAPIHRLPSALRSSTMGKPGNGISVAAYTRNGTAVVDAAPTWTCTVQRLSTPAGRGTRMRVALHSTTAASVRAMLAWTSGHEKMATCSAVGAGDASRRSPSSQTVRPTIAMISGCCSSGQAASRSVASQRSVVAVVDVVGTLVVLDVVEVDEVTSAREVVVGIEAGGHSPSTSGRLMTNVRASLRVIVLPGGAGNSRW